MKRASIVRGGVAAALSVAAAACSASVEDAPDFQVSALARMGDPNVRPDSAYYEEAVNAIGRRDYARALDYLQEARAKASGSARVLNAFGVVYDKLGRFDLSARYYAQAAALDPGSQTVARNMAYSRLLQGMVESPHIASVAPEAAMPDAVPVAAPTIPVVAESTFAASSSDARAESATPRVREALVGFAPVLEVPDHVAVAADKRSVNFAPVNIELSEDPGAAYRSVSEHAATKVVTPSELRLAAAVSLPALNAVPIAFDDVGPTANTPALRPLRVAVPTPLSSAAVAGPLREADNRQSPIGSIRASAALPAIGLTMSSISVAALAQVDTPELEASAARPAASQTDASVPAAKASRFVVGRPLRIVNASGRASSTGAIYRSLSALGWSISRSNPVAAANLKLTTVVYPVANAPIARALARTLPFPVTLKPDTSGARGIELVVGTDFLSFNPTGRRVPGVWRISFAALNTNNGVQ